MTSSVSPSPPESTAGGGGEGSKAKRRLGRWRRPAYAGFFAMSLLVPMGLRVAWEGGAELDAADRAAQRNAFDEEVMHLGRAVRWRLPVAGHDERAIERLFKLAEREQDNGPKGQERALVAYREIRRGLLGARAWGHVADADALIRANRKIATLMSVQEVSLGLDLSTKDDQYQYHLDLLQKAGTTGTQPTHWGALAFVLWAVSSIVFFTRGIDAKGRLKPRQATRWGFASMVLLGLWIWLIG